MLQKDNVLAVERYFSMTLFRSQKSPGPPEGGPGTLSQDRSAPLGACDLAVRGG